MKTIMPQTGPALLMHCRVAVWCLLIASGICGRPHLMGASPGDGSGMDEEMKVYKKTEASGSVAALHQRLDQGQAQLVYERPHGYLLSLLRELHIAPASQLLVASKTSPNKDLISPRSPRALYYNDESSVAYVPGADLIEIAANDPKLGVVFYTLTQTAVRTPRLIRDDRCLECHASSKTLNAPGLLVRSFQTKGDGDVDVLSGLVVNHRTPIADRWGGYYVTGTHGAQSHRGNVFGAKAIARHEKDPTWNANITDLRPFIDVSRYPDPGSDLVALMVLEHQAHMQNLITRLHYDALEALRNGDSLKPAYPAVEALLKYMLFVDEARLTAPVAGTSDFVQWFEQQGPKDSQSRSLRQFDLRTRLFKNPCSYLIYSPSFDGLPAPARKHIYRRLWQILSSEDTSPSYQSLAADTRRTLRDILIETKKELPAYWRL